MRTHVAVRKSVRLKFRIDICCGSEPFYDYYTLDVILGLKCSSICSTCLGQNCFNAIEPADHTDDDEDEKKDEESVSYTHLTLPTIYSV